MAVDVERPRRLFTVDEYHRMGEAGILGEDERVELIEGEIVQMSPIGPRHIGCVINATRLFITQLGDRAVVSPQNPVVIRPRSEPRPDLVLLRPRAVSYSRERPMSQDVLLAVEVADTTVRYDRLVKSRLYARAGIPESGCVSRRMARSRSIAAQAPTAMPRSRRTAPVRPSPAGVPRRQLRGDGLLRLIRSAPPLTPRARARTDRR